MPDRSKSIVTNTTPLIALTAATGNLDILRQLYTRVVVPYEVAAVRRMVGKILDDDLQTSDAETSIELNFAVLKFKHTVKKSRKK